MLLMVQATVHSSLGNWLRLQEAMGAQSSPHTGTAQRVQGASGFPAVLLWSSRAFVSFGSLIIVLQVRASHLLKITHSE